MSLEGELVFPAPVEVDLDDLIISGDNSFRVWLSFAQGGYMAIDFMPDSDAHREIVDVVAEIVNERLANLSEHGIVITGLTPASSDEADDAEDEAGG